MTTLRTAAQQALEALERYSGVDQRACDAEEALRAALAEPVQEPVTRLFGTLPVYDTQPQRKPLTDEEIRGFYYEHAKYQEAGARVSGWWAFARAIERAHEIGGSNG